MPHTRACIIQPIRLDSIRFSAFAKFLFSQKKNGGKKVRYTDETRSSIRILCILKKFTSYLLHGCTRVDERINRHNPAIFNPILYIKYSQRKPRGELNCKLPLQLSRCPTRVWHHRCTCQPNANPSFALFHICTGGIPYKLRDVMPPLMTQKDGTLIEIF